MYRCIDRCIDRCISMCIGMCVDMCIDMCIDDDLLADDVSVLVSRRDVGDSTHTIDDGLAPRRLRIGAVGHQVKSCEQASE